jgi:hypothetical protein
MGEIKVKRSPGHETESGNFCCEITVQAWDVPLFFASFPDFELRLTLPRENRECVGGEDIKSTSIPPIAQGITVEGWEAFKPGNTATPNADVMELCRLPTYQVYASKMAGIEESAIDDSDAFAVRYAEDVVGKPVTEITAEDYLKRLFIPFNEWLRNRYGRII